MIAIHDRPQKVQLYWAKQYESSEIRWREDIDLGTGRTQSNVSASLRNLVIVLEEKRSRPSLFWSPRVNRKVVWLKGRGKAGGRDSEREKQSPTETISN